MNQFEDQRAALAVMDKKTQYQNGWQKPQQKTQKRFEEMSLSELLDVLRFFETIFAEQYRQQKEMPELNLETHLHKTSFKIALVKSNIKRVAPEYILNDASPELVDALRNRIAELEAEIKELKG